MKEAVGSRRGFTLVELLVSISIISILVSLAVPAFVIARRRARSVACQNNLRQISMCLECYRQDFKKYPPAYTRSNQISYRYVEKDGTILSAACGLGEAVEGHIKDYKVLFCPAASDITLASSGIYAKKVGKHEIFISYSYLGKGYLRDYNGRDNTNHLGVYVNEVGPDGRVTTSRYPNPY